MTLYDSKPLTADSIVRRAKGAINRAIDQLVRLDGDDAQAVEECIKHLRHAQIIASRFYQIRNEIR